MVHTVKQAFEILKSNIELSDSFQEIISTHHKAVRKCIERFDSNIETKLIGSLQRKTRIKPSEGDIFDIDILVILGGFREWGYSGDGISPYQALKK